MSAGDRAPVTAEAGDGLPELVVDEVLADHARIMALILDDPNPIHFDLAAVAEAGLGDREVLQGGVTMGYVVSMLEAWAGPSALAEIECRFLANVVVGDQVRAGGRVVAVEDGVAVCEVWAERSDGVRADGVRAVEGRATVVLSG